MTEKRVMKLATRGKRFGAACIDAFVPFVSYLLYSAVMAANGIKINYPGYGYGNDFGYGYGYGFDYGYGMGGRHLSGASTAIMVVVFFILLAYIVMQLILFAKGKSIGKAILGLQVISSINGKPFRFWKMLFRECFVKSASGSVFGLGYIWILVDEKNRGWHDKILDSYVVDLKESERINLRRHLEKARAESSEPAASPVAESVSAPAAEPVHVNETEIREEKQPEVTETRADGDTSVEVIPEVIEAETGETEVTAEEVTAEQDAVTAEEVTEEHDEEVTAEHSEEAAGEPSEENGEEPDPGMTELSMSMKKEQLLEEARRRGVKVSSRATKAAIIEAIEKAAEETGN